MINGLERNKVTKRYEKEENMKKFKAKGEGGEGSVRRAKTVPRYLGM